MPRRANTLPTSIYLLVDCRPETVAKGWVDGEPFYCGKTVKSLQHRFRQHLKLATNDLKSERRLLPRIRECGEHIKIICVDTVPVGGNWWDAERRWIAWCREQYPGMVNTTDGGEGVPGLVCSERTKEKLRRLWIGTRLSEEHKAKMSAALKGRKLTPEHIERIRKRMTGNKPSEETRERLRQSHLGKSQSPEARAKIGATLKTRPVTEKQIADLNKARSMRKFGSEWRAKIGASRKGKKLPAEHYAKLSALFKGKKQPPEVVTRRLAALRRANAIRRVEKAFAKYNCKVTVTKPKYEFTVSLRMAA